MAEPTARTPTAPCPPTCRAGREDDQVKAAVRYEPKMPPRVEEVETIPPVK